MPHLTDSSAVAFLESAACSCSVDRWGGVGHVTIP